ncbi:hypothetical protein DPMN_186930 [Dreissena polymorpha]|uniref:YqaJ viral recombinase domain-containing protein n=1 Tax=Dreissena polymorpha TaxID=45954 RepID=A0A9D4DR68_DREPO|nr:hypothetical protein DPMN_186930 [Dreissena polymorpha]
MNHGSTNEINAIATIVGKIMPVFYPNFTFYEVGAHIIRDKQGTPVMVISPDGALRCNDKIVSVEIKCPCSEFVGNTPVFYKPKERHIIQCLLETHVLRAEEHIYISWSKESTTVFRLKPKPDLVTSVIDEVIDVYYADVPMKPKKLSERAKTLKSQIKEVADEAEFLGEFPSILSNSFPRNEQDIDEHDMYYRQQSDVTNVTQCLNDINDLIENAHKAIKLLNEAYQYQKPIASEVLVYLLSDMNRLWHRELGHGIPIAYLYKGYSLTIPTSRRILDKVLNECKKFDIHVPCITFDGHFFKLKDYDSDDKPLSLFALQRQIWSDITKMTKSQIIDHIDEMFRLPTYELVTEAEVRANGELHTIRQFFAVHNSNELCPPIVTAVATLKQNNRSNEHASNTADCSDTISMEDAVGFDDEVIEVLRSVGHSSGESNDISTSKDSDSETGGSNNEKEYARKQSTIVLNSEEDTHRVAKEAVITLDYCDYENILKVLQNTKRKKWHETDVTFIETLLKSPELMKNAFNHDELNSIIHYLSIKLSDVGIVIRKTLPKGEKIVMLCSSIGVKSNLSQVKSIRKKHRCIPSLHSLCLKCLRKKEYPKEAVAISFARCIWPTKKSEWLNNSYVSEEVLLEQDQDNVRTGTFPKSTSFFPVYSPEFSGERQQLEVKVMDGTHIRTNLKSKLIKNGLGDVKIDPWKQVAQSGKTYLRPAMLEVKDDGKILHQQSDPFVRTMFAEDVQEELLRGGHDIDAHFCKILRQWHEAEDQPGIPAFERCVRSLKLKAWLMNRYDFAAFPPPSQYVKGIPRVTFEGLVCSIDAHILLYRLVKGSAYNWRSVSTLVAENFMGELAERASTSNGVPSGAMLASDMGKISQLHAMRLKPGRYVHINTIIIILHNFK